MKNNYYFNFTVIKKLGKLSFFSVCLLFFMLLAAAGGYFLWFAYFREIPPPPAAEKVYPYLCHGDIILRSGIGIWSNLFCDFNEHDKRFSHAGIVIEKDNRLWVLHSEGSDITGRGNVHLDTVEYFISKSSSVGVSRMHTLDSALFAAEAEQYIGRVFDWKFDRSEQESIYCSELIDLALRKIPGGGDGLTVGREDIIPVDSCLDSRYFTEIRLPGIAAQ